MKLFKNQVSFLRKVKQPKNLESVNPLMTVHGGRWYM